MPATTQSQAEDLANQLNGVAAQFVALQQQLTVLNTRWTAINAQSVLDAMPTVTQNADGSQGTADVDNSTPPVPIHVSGHPINAVSYPGFQRATSSYNYGAMLTIAQQFLNLVNGEAVATQASAPTILAEMTGG